MKTVDRATRMLFESLKWRDPRTDLVELGRLQGRLAKEGQPPALDDLRNHQLKQYLEQRQAALFAYFISSAVLKAPIAYAMKEAEDYDCILWWKLQSKSCYTPVQLKEIVPPRINARASIETELSKLSKYASTSETIAAFHVNQTGPLDFTEVKAPRTGLNGIWLYAALSPDQSSWFLYGDLLKRRNGYEITWPN